MFHVERVLKIPFYKRIMVILTLFFTLQSCGLAKQAITIPDYILQPYGKEIIGKKNLTAFIFENNVTKIPLEQYLSAKFNTNNHSEKEYWVTIQNNKYKIIIYDDAEFEKYFNSANYEVLNQIPQSGKNGDQRKFIAISVINSYNEDCLANESLFQNIAVNHLRNLKNEYQHQ